MAQTLPIPPRARRIRRGLAAYAVTAFIMATLTGCGGSESNSVAPPAPDNESPGLTAADTPVESLLFYTEDHENGPVTLNAVDPRAPGNPVTVEDQLAEADLGPSLQAVPAGRYVGDALENAHQAWVIFFSNDGHLYRISTAPNDRVNDIPEPIRISSESAGQVICKTQLIPDYANPLDSVLLYELSDIQDCSRSLSTTTYLVRLNFGTEDSPITYGRTQAHAPKLDPETGALSELVFVEGNIVDHFQLDTMSWHSRIHKLDNQFQGNYQKLAVQAGSGKLILTDYAAGQVRVYNPNTRDSTLVEEGPNVPIIDPLAITDTLVFSEGMAFIMGTDPKLFGLDLAAHPPVLRQLSQTQYFDTTLIASNGQRVAWGYGNFSEGYIESVALDDSGSSTMLVAAQGPLFEGSVDFKPITSPAAPNNWIYYGSKTTDSLEYTAVDIRGSGFGETSVGTVVGNTWTPDSPLNGRRADRVLIKDSRHLVSIDAATPATSGRIDHGPIPSGLIPRDIKSFAPAGLFQMNDNSGTGMHDVVFVDTTEPSSTVRVTNNPDAIAKPVEGF